MKKLSFNIMSALMTIASLNNCRGDCQKCPFEELPCTFDQINYHLKSHGYATLDDFITYKEEWNH